MVTNGNIKTVDSLNESLGKAKLDFDNSIELNDYKEKDFNNWKNNI